MKIEASGYPMHNSPRCGAKTRQQTPCKAPAIRGKNRCRMQGQIAFWKLKPAIQARMVHKGRDRQPSLDRCSHQRMGEDLLNSAF